MHWFVLGFLVLLESALILVLLQGMSRFLIGWLRWPLWLALVAISVAGARYVINQPAKEADLAFTAPPYATYRTFLLTMSVTVPASLLILGAVSFLRWQRRGLLLVRWPVTWRHSLILVLVSFCGMVVTAIANDWFVRRSLRDLEQQSRQAALSVKPPDCPREENAASIYLDLGARPELSTKELPDFAKDRQKLLSSEWQKYFELNAVVVDRIRAAAQLPCCRFDLDWSDADPLAPYSEERALRSCVRALASEGLAAALKGDVSLAVRDAAALRRIVEQLCGDPRGIIHLLAKSAEDAALSITEAALYQRPLTAEETEALAHRPGFEFRQAMAPFFTWEEAERYRFTSMLYLGTTISEKDYKLPGHRQATAAVLFGQRLLYARDDLTAVPLIFAELKRIAAYQYHEKIPDRERVLPGGAKVVDSIYPMLTLFRMHIQADAGRVLTDFALHLSAEGLVDRILAEGPGVVPAGERPIDVRNAQPMRIAVKDGGVIVYSVGTDGRDDGGEEQRGFSGDLTFCFGEAYKRRRLTPPEIERDQALD